MQIISLYIRDFGSITDRTLDFSEGLNLIEGANESGKSTVIGFIRFIFYGLGRRAAGEELSDSERAFSWSTGSASGNMTLRFGGNVYRIERHEQAASPEKHLLIVNETTGEILPKGTTPEGYFLSFPKEVFDSSLCIRQMRAGELCGGDVSAAIENLIMAGDEALNADRALTALDRVRKSLLHKNRKGGEIFRLRTEITELREHLRAVRERMEARENAEESLERIRAELKRERIALGKCEADLRLSEDLVLLSRFRALRAGEGEEARLEKELRALTNSPMAEGRDEIDRTVRRLEDAAARLDAVLRDCLIAESARGEAPETGLDNARLASVAEAVRASGGTEAVRAQIRAISEKEKKEKSLPACLIALAALLFVALSVAAVAIPFYPLLLIAVIAAVGLTVPAILTKKRSKETARSLALLLSPFGLTGSEIDPESAFLSAAAGAFRAVEEARARDARRKELENRVTRAHGAVAREKDEIALRFGELLDAGEITPDTLRRAAKRLTALGNDIRRAEDEYAARKRENAALRRAVEGEDEGALLQRLPSPLPETSPDAVAVRAEINERRMRIGVLEQENLSVTERLSALRATTESEAEILSGIAGKTAECEALEQRYRAVQLAAEKIGEARVNLSESISPRLRREASRYLSVLSESRYGVLNLDKTLTPAPEADGVLRPIAALSGGTRDAIYLSIRLALSDLFGKSDEPLPLIFDEALSQLDDDRARAALELFLTRAEAGGQILLFTCQSRERTLLTASEAPFAFHEM